MLNPDVERYPFHRILIVITALIVFFNGQQVLMVCRQNKTLIALISYTLLSALWAENSPTVIKSFIFLISAFFISILTAIAFADKNTSLIRWLFWLFIFMNIGSIYFAYTHPEIAINTKDFGKPRWVGITTHPNALGATGLILIWLSSNLFFLTKSFLEKIAIITATCISLFVIIKADSMTSLVDSFIVIEVVCYYYLFNRFSLPIKIILITLGVIVVLFGYFIYLDDVDITSTAFKSAGRSSNFSGRTVLWDKSLSAFSDSPLIGYGFDELDGLTKRYHLLMSHLHNGYIEILVKGGIIASILLLYIFLQTLFEQMFIRVKRRENFIFLNTGFIMVLIHNITESSILKGLSALSIILILIIVSTSFLRIYPKQPDS
ncbi:O-antigen ligase family protein [Methylomonas paludis]|uniref:O-antigen ligase family protein n=1 Tax=Methylomonas paludis TaxID=1173101 RepID=A0A975MN48_9GAMM|nr:O-antigen ligase family protein [Methylomonas paludis]QWF70709.1 O-antigen ligase family protein [Methylomonas paludis]